jgi:hypothetical protein
MPADEDLLIAVLLGSGPGECEELWPLRAGADLGSKRVEVRSNCRAAIEYLYRLFTPGNDLWRAADQHRRPPALTVRCHVTRTERIARLVEHVAAIHRRSPHRPTRLHVDAPAAWIDVGGRHSVLVIGGTGQLIAPQLVSVRDWSQITIICCDTADAVLNLARHVREIGYRLAENHGWVCLHASAADRNGHTVAIVGDSGAGKTTMALALAARPDWRFLGNDRLMVKLDPRDGSLRAVALPCPVRLNAGTLRGLAIDGAHEWELTRPKPGPGSDWSQFRGTAKLNILPCEWQESTGTELTAGGQLAAVLLPAPDLGGDGIRITRHQYPTAPIAAQCMSPDDPVYVADWLGRRTLPSQRIRANAQQVVAAMAALPAFSVQFGTALALAPVAEQVAGVLEAAW